MFTFVGESGEPPITDYEIAAVVTVVNSSQVLYEISQAESLESLGLSPFVPPDYRHSADVVLEQIEFANILVLNRLEGIDISDRSRIRQLLEWLNPRADLLEQVDRSWTPEFAERLDRLLGNLMTDRNFDFFETEESAGWLQLIDGMHPKSRSSQQIEFDDRIESNRDWPELTSRVNGFVFRTRKPMHPDRLNLALDALAEMGVVRMKGWIWLASRNDTSGMICVSGPCCTLISAGPWTDGERVSSFEVYSSDRTNERRNSVVGDRRIEIAIIGFDLNELQVRRRLKTCILSEEEFALGPDAWRKFPDPLPPWIPGEEVDRTELQ